MNIASIQKQSVVNEVYEQMKKRILEGSWPPGSKLPSESALTAAFNVSRVSIRSAMQRLRDFGVITTLHGKGTFVANILDKEALNAQRHPIMHLSQEEFFDMMIFRQTVEFKCMELAVSHATQENIDELENALDRMLSNKEDYKKYSQADFDFHLAIARASKNKIFYSVMKSIKNMYYYYLEELNRALGITLESVEAHIKVFMAIKNRDSSMAVAVLDKAMAENTVIIQKIRPPMADTARENIVELKHRAQTGQQESN
ncbi:FadR family transcriptional regulator [Martelella alba]|uniref:FadR family transcriptional regulator n=2 Tax=Martelella alba TaxID=2590451 RepID=A0ABY2SQS1_9HYPH|nr:FadR family transcriptional regulator [Martelella alba]